MEVILIENIEKLGKVGDVVKVKDGYARNYLIPKKKVLRASKENLKVFEEKKSVIEAEEKKRKIKSEEIAKKIKDLEVIIIRNAAENGQLYGSVTSKDIIKEIVLLSWLIIAILKRYSSLASILTLIILPIFSLLFSYEKNVFYLFSIISLLIIFKHYSNIIRLINKVETKIKF